MAGTYSQILLHIVFSTKHREPHISDELAHSLYPYMGGIVRGEKGVLYEIGGMSDHVHLYLRWRPSGTISELVQKVKSGSSLWVHENVENAGAFAWQEGYSVFTVSKSREPAVKSYIVNQKKHHTRRDFKQELLELLRAHDIEYDERYVFD